MDALSLRRAVECNICGGQSFLEFNKRGRTRCADCGSIERTRVFALYLRKYGGLHPGKKVLHLAPEPQLFTQIAEAVGPSYDARDIDTQRYSHLKGCGVSVQELDLCTDCDSLPSDYYDLIMHNHVLEHVPCNVTAVLWHLHRSLSPTGLHMFSIPIVPGRYEESLSDLTPDERQAKFHHPQHMRNFGRESLLTVLGMVFDIEKDLKRRLVDEFPRAELARCKIPRKRWKQFNGAQPFLLSKSSLKLR